MALSAAERVKRWQTKSRLKAFYFDDVDERRRRLLTQQFGIAEGDQALLALISDLFFGLPRCILAPRWVKPWLDGWGVSFPDGATQWEEAIACMVIQRNMPGAVVYAVHEGAGQMTPQTWLYPDIDAEVAHLQAMGLWNTTPVVKRTGVK